MKIIECLNCGNKISKSICPHCATSNQVEYFRGTNKKSITISIKENMPTAEEAKRKVDHGLQDGKRNGVKIIKFIHGYGSTGKGGVLRKVVRQHLQQMNYGLIITGEKFSVHDKSTKELIHDFPILRKDYDLNKQNKGITIFAL